MHTTVPPSGRSAKVIVPQCSSMIFFTIASPSPDPPRFADALKDLSVVRVAVNQDYVGQQHALNAGDEVAIFPPVTGG